MDLNNQYDIQYSKTITVGKIIMADLSSVKANEIDKNRSNTFNPHENTQKIPENRGKKT